MRPLLKFFSVFFLLFPSVPSFCGPNPSNPVSTGVPFLLIGPDAASGGMAEIGAATSPDAYSQFWNPSKYAFAENTNGLSLSYTPWLTGLVDDIFLGYVTYYHKTHSRGALGASLRFFNMGKIDKTGFDGSMLTSLGNFSPNELSVDLSYSLQLSPHFSLGLALRYIYSNISDRTEAQSADFRAAHGIGADISGYYTSRELRLRGFEGRVRVGFNLSNLGPAISYHSSSDIAPQKLPTNFRLGVGFDFIPDAQNVFSLQLETNKLLVPTPREVDGVLQSPDMGLVGGIFNSLWEAPGGFSEKMREINFQLGFQYAYRELLQARAGYHFQAKSKGGNQYVSLGVGVKYRFFGADFSYLFPTLNDVYKNPMANTLRISLSFDFGRRTD